MFTGIIQWQGRIVDVRDVPAGRRLVIDVAGWRHRAAHGESIAINGCCLTVTAVDADADAAAGSDGPRSATADHLHFDAIPQTLSRTTLGDRVSGDSVNLEPAATPTTLMGGHIVQGHIDGVGTVRDVSASADGGRRVRIDAPASSCEFIIDRGSIAVDGVSLTVASVGQGWFEVALIPVTLRDTTLGALTVGQRVNLETDYVARAAITWLKRQQDVVRQ